MRRTIALAALAAAVTVAGCSPHIEGPAGTPVAENRVAPGVTGKTLTGKTVRLADFHGKTVLLNFFSTGCGFCHEEYPHLIDLQKKYGSQGFQTVSVCIEDLDKKDLRNFLGTMRPKFPIIHASPSPNEAYDLTGLPTNILIGPDGRIKERLEGGYNADEWNKRLIPKITGKA